MYPAEVPKFNPKQSNSAARQTPKDKHFFEWRFLARGQKAPKTHTKKTTAMTSPVFPQKEKSPSHKKLGFFFRGTTEKQRKKRALKKPCRDFPGRCLTLVFSRDFDRKVLFFFIACCLTFHHSFSRISFFLLLLARS